MPDPMKPASPGPNPADSPVRLTAHMVQAKARSLSQRNPLYREICGLLGALLTAALEPPAAPGPPYLPEHAEQGLAQGRAVYDPASLELDWAGAWALWERLTQVSAHHGADPAMTAALEKIAQKEQGGPGLFRALITRDQDALQAACSGTSATPQVLAMFLHLALRPGLRAMSRQALARLDITPWSLGCCPVCASPPKLASLQGAGGQRFLHCSLCETQWPHARLQCPNCGGSSPGRITRLQAKGEEGLWVEACNVCHGYIKTMDLRALGGPVILHLDDAATCHLDIIAAERMSVPA